MNATRLHTASLTTYQGSQCLTDTPIVRYSHPAAEPLAFYDALTLALRASSWAAASAHRLTIIDPCTAWED